MWQHLWTVNILKSPKDCLNHHASVFIIFFDHYEKKSVQKIFVLAVSQILRLFVNILTPDDMYSLSVKASV